jgi:hypothetical protein
MHCMLLFGLDANLYTLLTVSDSIDPLLWNTFAMSSVDLSLETFFMKL